MAYKCYLGGVLMPETPGQLTIKIKGQNSTLVLLNGNEINFLKSPGLSEITLPLTFPMLTGSKRPEYYLNHLEKLKAGKAPTQFIMTRTTPGGSLLFDTNIKVSIEDYNITENAENGLDVSVEVKLKQYRDYSTKTVTITTTTPTTKPTGNTSKPTGGNTKPSTSGSSTSSAGSTTFKVGDVVKITGNTYYNGGTIPSWVKAKNWIVYSVSGDRVVINKSVDGKNAIMSPVKASNLALVSSSGSTTKTATVTTTRETTTAPKATTYTVKKGDTLWAISKKYLGSGAKYNTIYNANKGTIKNPNLIYVGQVLTIPAVK